MLSAFYLEKQSDYIVSLNFAASLACLKDRKQENITNLDTIPCCRKCCKAKSPKETKTKKLREINESETTNHEDGRLSLSMLQTNEQLSRKNAFNNDENALDKTFVSTIMRNLLDTKTTPQILNRSCGVLKQTGTTDLNRSYVTQPHLRFTRRPSFVADDSIVLSAAKVKDKQSSEQEIRLLTRTRINAAGSKERPVSYPNASVKLNRRKTCSVLLCNPTNKCQYDKQTDNMHSLNQESENKHTVDDTPDQFQASEKHNSQVDGGNCVNSQQEWNVKSREVSKKSHDMYYSLSPMMLQEAVKNSLENMNIVTNENNDKDDTSDVQESSLSSNPEYFVLSNSTKKRRRKKNKSSPRNKDDDEFSSDGETETSERKRQKVKQINDENNRKHVFDDETNFIDDKCNRNEINQAANTSIQCGMLMSSLKTRNDAAEYNANEDISLQNEAAGPLNVNDDEIMRGSHSNNILHDFSYDEGSLLYATGFNLSDYAINSEIGESDFIEDGYCKCSFCNHEMIYTQGKGEVGHVADRSELSVTSPYGHKPRYMHQSCVQLGHSGNRRRRIDRERNPNFRNFNRKIKSNSVESFCECSDSEDDVVLRHNYTEPSVAQKALQRDIEKHSDGVAAVLSLCDVLLHDGDACSSEGDKESIEHATNSLDRRWKNICALSMERKLKIEETRHIWQKFMDDFSSFNEWMRNAEDTLRNPNTYRVPYYIARQELKKFEKFQRLLHESLTQLELINKQYRRLARENRTDSNSKLKSMVHNININWDKLSGRLTGILRRLKFAIARRETFESLREELRCWVTEIDLQLTNVEFILQLDLEEKFEFVKKFQERIEERIPQLQLLDERGETLIAVSDGIDSEKIEEELEDFHSYCRQVIARLDKYNRRLLSLMNQPPTSNQSLFDESELASMSWFDDYSSETSSFRTSSPEAQLADADSNMQLQPPSFQKLHSSNSGRVSPASQGSLEWDLYDISQSELETPNNGDLTDDSSIPEISPLEMVQDEAPLLSVSKDSVGMATDKHLMDTSQDRDFDPSNVLEMEAFNPSSAKKPKLETKKTAKETQFLSDLNNTLHWLRSIIKVANKEKNTKSIKTIPDLSRECHFYKDFVKSIDQRRPIVLSIRLVARDFQASNAEKLSEMNTQWDEVVELATQWNMSLQHDLILSHDFGNSLKEIREWLNEQFKQRADVIMTSQSEGAIAIPEERLLSKCKEEYAQLKEIRQSCNKHETKIAEINDICGCLLHPSTTVRDVETSEVTNVQSDVQEVELLLRSLRDRIRHEMSSLSRNIKSLRKKQGQLSSDNDSDSSIYSNNSVRQRKLQRQVTPSELHSSGRKISNEVEETNISMENQSENQLLTTQTVVTDRIQSSTISSTLQHITTKDEQLYLHEIQHTLLQAVKAETTQTLYEKQMHNSLFDKSSLTPIIADKNRTNLLARAFRAALPFYILIFLLLLVLCLSQRCDDCMRKNNYFYSLSPMISYPNGPPPI